LPYLHPFLCHKLAVFVTVVKVERSTELEFFADASISIIEASLFLFWSSLAS
jgi:hypothetical protein